MNLREVLYSAFDNIIDYKTEETFTMFKVLIKSASVPRLDLSFFDSIKNYFNFRDTLFSLSLSFNNDDPIEYYDKPTEFIDEIDTNMKFISELDVIDFKLEISKSINNNTLSVYDLDSFGNYLSSLSLSGIIHSFYSTCKHNFFFFEIQNTSINLTSYSNTFCFKTKDSLFEKVYSMNLDVIKNRKTICNFLNDETFNYEPDSFVLSSTINDKIDILFSKLKIVYSLVSIFDISQIKDNSISLSVNGYKSTELNIDFRSLDIINANLYYEIFSWIYSEGTLSDKVGIARNIISLYLVNSNNINIDKSALSAIKSNYNMYLKENVEKYLDLKSKIVESLISFEKSINELSSTVTDGFIKNLGAIGTFIITAIIMNSFSEKKLNNIFTKDITIISLALILVSLIYLAYTLIETKSKLRNLIFTYYRFKNGYTDILVRKDINILFNKNRFFKRDIKRIKNKIKLFSIIWTLVLFVFLLVVVYLGFEHITNIFKPLF